MGRLIGAALTGHARSGILERVLIDRFGCFAKSEDFVPQVLPSLGDKSNRKWRWRYFENKFALEKNMSKVN